MPNHRRTSERVKEVVTRALKLNVKPEEIPDDEPLFGDGLGGASIAVLEVICAIEEEFAIEITDDELRMDLFSTVESVVEYVAAKTKSSGRS